MLLLIKRNMLWSVPTAVIALAISACILPVRLRRLEHKGLKTTVLHEAGLAVFVVYLSVLLTITLDIDRMWVALRYGFPFPNYAWLNGTYNLIPFGDINSSQDVIMLFENIALFWPLSLFILFLWDKLRWWQIVLTGAAVSLSIECLQLVTGRAFDVNDLIMNTLGATLGLFTWLFISRWPRAAKLFRCPFADGAHSGP